jgi:galactokinase
MIVTDNDASSASRITERFKTLFAEEPVVTRSPGRVNLIGEHTDYNNGFVLPAAINKAIYMAVSPRNDHELHFVSEDLDLTYQGDIHRLVPSRLQWPDYLLGVIEQ